MFHPAIFLMQAATSLAVMAAGLAVEGKAEPGGIFGNTYLTLFCAGGSGIGGCLYIIFNYLTLKTAETTVSRILKFLASFMIGMTAGPSIILHFHLSQAAEDVLGTSVLMGLFGWSLLTALFPWLKNFFANLIKSLLTSKTGTSPDK